MAQRSKSNSYALRAYSSHEVGHRVGRVGSDTIPAILKCRASTDQLEIAAGFLLGEGDEFDRIGQPLTGKLAQIYDILCADEFYADRDAPSATRH